ncbi:hypothetical protein [Breznakia pachnodae]|uniref:GIY-YIG domain-containing protein n=1 Tax=Breznakia pachnodae TaxID=265178 RepID=A0ABU0E4N7_9FIRM|nr:hypothetical protein [Breznakia pachnodae]MDQ0361857.1 hypothetical protein [Breznakia pachnodae]
MFGTVILDSFSKKEIVEIKKALEILCNPSDYYGWSSHGIYCFWDYNTKEVLYIGLASDLELRFCQHLGIIRTTNESCKYKKIMEYFKLNERLGYTIFVQSPLAQGKVYRNKVLFDDFIESQDAPLQDYSTQQGIADIKRVEGILIESYRLENGQIPPWNEVGGSIIGQKKVMTNNINIVKSFTDSSLVEKSFIMSRSTLRELASNPTYERYENHLHAARILALNMKIDFSDALSAIHKFSPDTQSTMQDIINSKYLEKKLLKV